jgi:mRNA-degrading endonuclease RelE of RelBE toxin-antitoxin system
MGYEIRTISVFERQAKRLLKKYPSLKSELALLGSRLSEHPELGTPIGRHCFKVRIAIASKGKGKSGGARVITNFVIAEGAVYLLNIYDKSEKDSLTDKELLELLSYLPS